MIPRVNSVLSLTLSEHNHYYSVTLDIEHDNMWVAHSLVQHVVKIQCPVHTEMLKIRQLTESIQNFLFWPFLTRLPFFAPFLGLILSSHSWLIDTVSVSTVRQSHWNLARCCAVSCTSFAVHWKCLLQERKQNSMWKCHSNQCFVGLKPKLLYVYWFSWPDLCIIEWGRTCVNGSAAMLSVYVNKQNGFFFHRVLYYYEYVHT